MCASLGAPSLQLAVGDQAVEDPHGHGAVETSSGSHARIGDRTFTRQGEHFGYEVPGSRPGTVGTSES